MTNRIVPCLMLSTLILLPAAAATSVPLTIQEALYPGGFTGANRANESFCQGVALPDAAGISSTAVLGLSGTSAGQFRILGKWPSGNIKWVKVCGIVPSISAGGTATVTLADGASGNFGGTNLATDNGGTITVTTGAATFVVKKSNFNGIDSAVVGGTTVVSSGTSAGFVIAGPSPTAAYPGNVTCSPTPGGTACTTLYKSSNDSSSTCLIEENGPVMSALKCTWNYADNSGHIYMHGIARLYFYQGKSNIKITSAIRNADYGTANTFATAYKGVQEWTLRLGAALSGTTTYTIGNETTSPTSGTMSAGDDVYLYQGLSSLMQFSDNNLWVPYTSDQGYHIVKNGGVVRSGSNTQSPKGWCDISSSTGVGIEVGIYQMAPYGSKGCEFASGGSDVRVGLLDAHNSQPYYLEWPQWDETTDVFVEFHASAPASLDTEFQKFQAYLVARQGISDINAANVFPYPLISAVAEDAYETSIFNAASPTTIPPSNAWSVSGTTQGQDFGVANSNYPLNIVRDFSWNLESEYRWGYLMTFLQRGWTGHWLEAAHWYRWQSGYNLARADGFTWRSYGPPGNGTLDAFGQPSSSIISANNTRTGVLGHGNWMTNDSAASGHSAWYGEIDYYFMSGDEFINDHLKDAMEDYYLVTGAVQWGANSSNTVNVDSTGKILTMTCCIGSFPNAWIGQVALIGSSLNQGMIASVNGNTATLSNAITPNQSNAQFIVDTGMAGTRALGHHLISVPRFATWMDAVGESGSSAAVQQAINLFGLQVKSQLCVSGYPAGCDAGTVNNPSTWRIQGVSYKRGIAWGQSGNSGNWCGEPNTYRVNSSFQSAILAEGITDLARYMGPSWSDYWTAKDLAYGIARFATSELFVDNSSSTWNTQGFRFGLALDVPNNCNASTDLYTVQTFGTNAVTNIGSKPFNTGGYWPTNAGGSIGPPPLQAGLFVINGTPHSIASVTDANHLTLNDSAAASTSQTAIMQEQDYQYASSQLNVAHLFYVLWNTEGAATVSTWQRRANISLLNAMSTTGTAFRDFQNYYETNLINTINNPGTASLQNVAITSFTDMGGGSYTIGWSTPGSTQYLRVKWAPTSIVDWIGFDSGANAFTGTSSNTPWFAANNVSGVPAPSAGSQSMTINTGVLGLTAASFSVKAFTGSGSGTTGSSGPGPASTLILVSGNGQSGAAGQPLASPFVVAVTDSHGNPISGVTVNFAVTAGGGSLTVASGATNSLGQASTILTLGTAGGSNTVTASSAGLTGSPIVFSATGTGTAGTATAIAVVSGSNQSGTAGQPLASPFIVQVNNASGSPVSGVSVTFAVTSGGGTLSTTSATTNSSGQASTTLTLGPGAGTNTVTASSTGLADSPITFTATAVSGSGGGSGTSGSTGSGGGAAVTWTLQQAGSGWPSYVGWTYPQYDPVSQQTIFYVGPPSGAHGIYSTDIYAYNSGTNVFTHITGTGSSADLCPADTATLPGDRHPGWQMAVDTKRSMMWLYGGVNGACNGSYVSASGNSITMVSGASFVTNGSWNNLQITLNGVSFTIASVTDSSHLTLTTSTGGQFGSATNVLMLLPAPNTNPRRDMYYLQLTPNPVNDTWHQVLPAHLPATSNSVASMIYDPDDDVLFAFGYDSGANTHDNWVYCRTAENTPPGTPTAKQLAAGCSNPDDWNQVNPTGAVQPMGSYFPGMVYDTVNKEVILYGGGLPDGVTFYNQTWVYRVPTQTWTQKALSTTPPPVYNGPYTGQPALAYNPVTHTVIYHQTSNAGAPADWQYDAAADTWTKISSGGGASVDQMLALDQSTGSLVGWSLDSAGQADVYKGSFGGTTSGASSPASPCDLNSDGVVNNADVQIVIAQALGTSPCTNGDLAQTGTCNIVDVQRVIIASLGGVCKTGQ